MAKHYNNTLIILGLIGIFILPQLNNVHYDPQPQFWAEITTAWAILGLFIVTIFNFPRIYLPAISIPLILFAIYLIIQPNLVAIDFAELNYVSALEMGICALLAITVNTIQKEYGLSYLVTQLSYILLIGALLQTAIGFIQYTGNSVHFGDLIFYDSDHPSTNIFGHFGQRNHYAHYLTWGTFAVIYLSATAKIPTKLFYLLITWLSFSLTIAASRSVLIYFPLGLIICLIYRIFKPDTTHQRLFNLMLSSTLILVTMEYFYPLIHNLFNWHNNISSGLERISTESGTGRRGIEWKKAWLVFNHYPLFGAGWNQFAKQSVLLHHLFPKAPANSGLFTNCHNLILQLLAETGSFGSSIVVGGIFISVYRTLKTNLTVEIIIMLCMLSTTIAHSMNEYPLWYLYFLAGLIFFLALDPPLLSLNPKLVASSCALPLAFLVYLMLANSIVFANLVNDYDPPETEPDFLTTAHYLQHLVDNNSLAAYFALYTLDNYIKVDSQFTNHLFPALTQLHYTHKLASFHPYPDTLIKEAKLEWNLGHRQQAQQLITLAVIAFPVYTTSFKQALQAKKYQSLRHLVK